ncbi:MAG: hypothetical protein ACREIA_07200 [Opitutaceae bacterium]
MGALGEHFELLFADAPGESACSERRQGLPWEVFADLMRRALRPVAGKRRHKESFWRGWRLVAVDGTQFSLSNTPQNNAQRPKAKSRRGRAAFASPVRSSCGVACKCCAPSPQRGHVSGRKNVGNTQDKSPNSKVAVQKSACRQARGP